MNAHGKEMSAEDFERLDAYMSKLNVEVAARWCKPGALGCACLGCCNYSAGLAKRGFTFEDWQEWWMRKALQMSWKT